VLYFVGEYYMAMLTEIFAQAGALNNGYVRDLKGTAIVTNDTSVPVADHQARGRRKRFYSPSVTIPGSWIKGDGVLRARDIGISPYNSAADNVAAWNVWRDEMQTVQERQELRPLLFVFDEDLYKFNASLEVRQMFTRIEGRSAVLDFQNLANVGINFRTSVASDNHLDNCGIRDLTIRNTLNDGLRIENAPYFVGENISVLNAGGHGINAMSNISLRLREVTAINCVSYGVIIQCSNLTTISSGVVKGVSIDTKVEGADIRYCGGGVAAYEVQSLVLEDVRCQVNGGVTGRGISIETGLNVTIRDPYFEKQRYDIVIEKVARIHPATQPHGSIRIEGADVGGELLQPGNIVPISLYVTSDTPNLTVPDGRFGGIVNIATAGTTGELGSHAEIGASNFATTSPNFLDARGRFDSQGLKLKSTNALYVAGQKVVGARGAAVTAPSGGTTVDAESRAAISALINRLQQHGLIS
jgi:hypothetical protein